MRAIAGCAVFLATWLPACAAPADPTAKILTYREYATIQHGVPYVLEFSVGDGALLIYGIRHTFDPTNPLVADIKEEWERFGPTVAYNEGGNPPAESSIQAAVGKWGEPGLVRFLAAWYRVPVATFEPFRKAQTEALLESYTTEQVKVFEALLTYLTFRKSKSDKTAEVFMNGVLGDKNGIQVPPHNVKELEVAYRKLFPGHRDWRSVPDEWFDPTKTIQYTNEIQSDAGHFRDRHIFNVLVARARRGDRVLAVIGSSHVPVLEPALTAALGNPVRKRNGDQQS